MMTDSERLDSLRSIPKYLLSYDDSCLLSILESPDLIKQCVWCGHPVSHSITSVCAGHGDFPRYVNIKCNNCCFEITGCIDYGDTYIDVRNAYFKKYNDLKEKFKND